jgi:hypothetical protein
VVHPAVVAPVVLAWLAFAAVLVGAVLFGQTARTAPLPRRTRSSARLGLLVSLSGPWLVALVAALGGAVTGEWLAAAAIGTCGLALVAVLGVTLHPH